MMTGLFAPSSRPTITLRDYQSQAAVDVRQALREARTAERKGRVILQSETGSGKSYIAGWMIREAVERGMSCWIVVHRRELMNQFAETLWNLGVRYSFIASKRPYDPRAKVHICLINTLVRRMRNLPKPGMVVFDECHHSTANMWLKVIEACAEAWMIGLTATPARGDGIGLGAAGWDAIVRGPSMPWLMQRGHLCDYEIIGSKRGLLDMSKIRSRAGDYAKGETVDYMEKAKIVGDAILEYKKHVGGKTCLVYCVTRIAARSVRDRYRAAGVNAHYVGGDTPASQRDLVMQLFKTGDIPVVVSVDLFGEGLDAPGLHAVQFLRPTRSLPLYRQMVGRALRPEEGKDKAIVLDPVGNTLRHGLPEDPYNWTLDGKKTSSKTPNEPVLHLAHCEFCFAIFLRSKGHCPRCGTKVPPKKEAPKEVEGELEKLRKEEIRKARMAKHRAEERQAWTFEDLVVLAISRGYKPGWAAGRWMGRNRKKGLTFRECIRIENTIRRKLKEAENPN